jgi:Cft2 family RNA processing exonuclease
VSPPRLRFDADGIEVENGLLWLDARKPKPLGLVTHAHGDHVARHRTILCTPETAELVRLRSGPGSAFRVLRFHEPQAVGPLRVTLLPAGHILGSAMALLEGPGGSLLYTGDVRPEGGLTCPPAEPAHADVLVTEATFGLPEHRLPPPAEVRADLVAFARDTLAAGATPVFLAYALGKGQEVLASLAQAGIPAAAHGTIWNLCRVYRAFGITFKGSRRLGRDRARRAAIVVPPRFRNTTEVRAAAPLRIAAVTGWGHRVLGDDIERVFPLSDHADYDGLVDIVERVAPGKVYVVHGYAQEFAADLRARGFDAEAVAGHRGPRPGEKPGMFF